MDAYVSSHGLLAQVLDAAALRHRVIAQNVANVNTPGYRRLAVAFQDDLASALALQPGGPPVRPRVVEAGGGPERVDGNNVDIDQEMNNLTKNALLYEAAAQILTSRIGLMRSAITGR
jgi:flagellar basal-body rod protein FlgB